MDNFQNSKEYNEIVKNLNDKNFSKALKKIDSISKKYLNENIVLKLYAVTYFNLMEWEKAIEYFKKSLNFEQAKYKIYTNIGVSYFKLGKINQSIEAFKNSIEENPSFGLAYNNLGVSYLELGMFDKAVDQFISALKLNDSDDNAKTKLINTFNLIKPKANDGHQLIKINNKINNLVKDNDINSGYHNNYIKILLEKSNQLINGYTKNLRLNETQIFRKNSENLNCGRHFKVFNEFNVIPKYCFGCYKIQINLKTVVDLIKLFLIFNKIKLRSNNIRKCIIENRNKIQGNYKGYIYCKGISEAETIKKMIGEMISQSDIGLDNITLKHGCSEFYESYPEFKKINPNKPLILMGYFNLIYQNGEGNFLKACKSSGVDGLIIVDLPPEEDSELCIFCLNHKLHFIRLLTPTSDNKRLPTLLDNSSGFLYYVSVAGVTGSKVPVKQVVASEINRIKKYTDLPICVGFGIKSPEDAKSISLSADGVVVGSAIIETVQKGASEREVSDFISSLSKSVHSN